MLRLNFIFAGSNFSVDNSLAADVGVGMGFIILLMVVVVRKL